MATVPISALADHVQQRLEETVGSPGGSWSRQYEIYTALIEAENDLLLLIGRPTQVVNLPFSLQPNTVWQALPKGYFCMTDIQGPYAALYKYNLVDFDYLQISWGANWQQDVGPVAKHWCPLGFNLFVVHPAVSQEQIVNITAIQYPTTDSWPYSGNELVAFEDNFFQLLEEYAAFYARIKELGAEFQEGLKLFDAYMKGAQRMTEIADRRDPFLFSSGYGATQKTNPITKR